MAQGPHTRLTDAARSLLAGLTLWALSGIAFGALPEAGTFLVANRQLQDPNFAESVVLVISSDPNGVMGLIVNRPSERLASELLPDMQGMDEFGGRLYRGGPVARYGVIMLVRNDSPPPEALRVTDRIYVSGNQDFLAEVVASGGSAEDWVRLFAGHAGWSAGQLENEIGRGDWTVKPATEETIFSVEPEQLWRKLAPPRGTLTVHR